MAKARPEPKSQRPVGILCAKAQVGSGLVQIGGPGPGFWERLEGRLYPLSAPGSAIGWEKWVVLGLCPVAEDGEEKFSVS